MITMTEDVIENRKIFADFLDNCTFKQSFGTSRNIEEVNCYCPLFAFAVSNPHLFPEVDLNYVGVGALNPELLEYFGLVAGEEELKGTFSSIIITLNDAERKTFKEIAAIIREKYLA